MKDVEKTSVERENSSKRLRRRKRKMNLYSLIVILLVLTVGVTVSYTFLFNINEIKISGESDQYTAEQILQASGIQKGDNLLRLNTHKSEQNILDALLYVETADVDRHFPSSLEITVSKCVPAFNVVYEMGTLLVSKQGKILADNGFITTGLPVFYGYDPMEKTPGKPLSSEDEQKHEAFLEFIDIINDTEQNIIASVDMTDKYAMLVNYSNGIIFKMGNWTDIEYKLNMANNVMNDKDVEGKTGYITMIGSNECSFRINDDPVYIPGVTPQTTEPVTGTDIIPGEQGESGESQPVTNPAGEIDEDQEEIFREHNEALTEATESPEE